MRKIAGMAILAASLMAMQPMAVAETPRARIEPTPTPYSGPTPSLNRAERRRNKRMRRGRRM